MLSGIKAPLPERQVDEPGDPHVMLFVPYFGFSADSVYLSPAPIYHVRSSVGALSGDAMADD